MTDIPFVVSDHTEQLFVRIHSITAQLPPAQQNPFFTDDVFLRIQSSGVHTDDYRARGVPAPRGRNSSSPSIGPRPASGASRHPATGPTPAPSPTRSTSGPQRGVPAAHGQGEDRQRREPCLQVRRAGGYRGARDAPEWKNMNGNYPISDVDVILTPPSGPVVNSCNTGADAGAVRGGQPGGGHVDGDGSSGSASRTSASRPPASTTRCGSKQTARCSKLKRRSRKEKGS